jgi:hypothetical protein
VTWPNVSVTVQLKLSVIVHLENIVDNSPFSVIVHMVMSLTVHGSNDVDVSVVSKLVTTI